LLLKEADEDIMAADVRGEIDASPGVGLGGAVGKVAPDVDGEPRGGNG
jgi:hypothetical protein